MPDTYGFGSTEPSRTTTPERDGDKVSTSEGESPAPVSPPWDEDVTTGTVRGQAPQDGLMSGDADCNSDWETTTIKEVGTVSTPTGTGNTLGGSWPIAGSALNPPLSHEVGSEDTDWTGHKPGTVNS